MTPNPAGNSLEETARQRSSWVGQACQGSPASQAPREREAPRETGVCQAPGGPRERRVCRVTQDRRAEKECQDPQGQTGLRATADLTAWTVCQVLRARKGRQGCPGETALRARGGHPVPRWAASEDPRALRDPRDPQGPRGGTAWMDCQGVGDPQGYPAAQASQEIPEGRVCQALRVPRATEEGQGPLERRAPPACQGRGGCPASQDPRGTKDSLFRARQDATVDQVWTVPPGPEALQAPWVLEASQGTVLTAFQGLRVNQVTWDSPVFLEPLGETEFLDATARRVTAAWTASAASVRRV